MITLSKLASAASSENKRVFGAYAGRRKDRWCELIGQRITHEILGEGTIIDLQHSPVLLQECLYIEFAHETRHFKVSKFLDDPHILTLTLSEQTITTVRQIVRQIRAKRAENEQREQERLETLRLEAEHRELRRQEQEEQLQREAQAKEEFELLKIKYLASKHKDVSPSSPLYVILVQLEDGEMLDDAQIDWLKANRLPATLALHFQERFKRSRETWDLIKASRFWRDAGEPNRSITLTNYLLKKQMAQSLREKSAILTTRGGAFRDLNNLDEAEKCAEDGAKLNPESFQPYNLLGAICFERGEGERGEEYFILAAERGAQPRNQESQMQNALNNAGPAEKVAVARYLLAKDAGRYKWAEYYLRKQET